MEKSYKLISLFFVIILAIVVLGFYKTYFGLFPTFNNVTNIQHLHGLLFLLWFLMLTVQPLLIKKGQYEWHRIIGKASYFLVPLIVISIFYIAKEYYDTAQLPLNQKITNLYVPFYQIFNFVTLYLLAIHYRKRSSYHMRYMIATSLAVYGAALKRLFINFMGVSGPNAFLYTFLVSDLILIGFIMYDWRHKQSYKPYIVALVILFTTQLGFYTFRYTEL
jgi:hypothetical protein